MNKKIITIFSLISLLVLVSLSLFYFIDKRILIKKNINSTKIFSNNYFNTFKLQDIKSLSATLDGILINKELKNLFIEGDREILNKYSQPLFQKLKKDYGITHFYFHLPDGTTFLRLHQPVLFGDSVNRVSFKEAVDSKSIGAALELGKTAFALRVVKPFYDNQKLIGYIELGEEIDHFLKILKNETGNEYSLFVEKEKLSEKDWISTRENAGLENDWGKFNKYILINSTTSKYKESEKVNSLCFNEVNVNKLISLNKNDTLVENIDNNVYCSGFEIFDESNNVIGFVLFSYDVGNELNIINNFLLRNILLIFSLFIFIFIFSIFFLRRVKIAEEKYKFLFDYSNDAVMTLNPPDWRFTDGNSATIDIYGLRDIDELKEITPADVSPEYQPDGMLSSEKAKNMINIAMEKGYHSFEWTHKKIRGAEFIANVSLIRIEIGKNIFLQAVVRDITNEKKSIELIKKANDEAQKALKESDKINQLMVGRELEMVKLKKEIKELKNKK